MWVDYQPCGKQHSYSCLKTESTPGRCITPNPGPCVGPWKLGRMCTPRKVWTLSCTRFLHVRWQGRCCASTSPTQRGSWWTSHYSVLCLNSHHRLTSVWGWGEWARSLLQVWEKAKSLQSDWMVSQGAVSYSLLRPRLLTPGSDCRPSSWTMASHLISQCISLPFCRMGQ